MATRTRSILLAAILLMVAPGDNGSRVAGAATEVTDAAVIVPVTPYRILDTRSGQGVPNPGPVGAGATIDVQIAGVGPVPANAVGVVINLTGTQTTAPTYVTAWPTGEVQPTASVLNLTPGIDGPNGVTARLGDGGRLSLFNFTGSTHLVADVAAFLLDAGAGGGTGPQGPQGPPGPQGPAGAPGVVRVNVVTGSEARPDVDFVIWLGGSSEPLHLISGDLWVPAEPVAPTVTTTALDGMVVGAPFSQTLTATGTEPVFWSVSSGALPPGLALSSSGVLSGTPSVSGAFAFDVQATNAAGAHAAAYSGTVMEAPEVPTITTTMLDVATVGAPFAQQLNATGTTPITWAVTSGALPEGLTLSTGGHVSGTPVAAETYAFSATATNAAGADTQLYTGSVAPQAVIDSFRLPTDVGPTTVNKQCWGGAFSQGVVVTPTQELLLRGVNWWRIGTADEAGYATPYPTSTLLRFHVALAAGGSPPIASVDGVTGALPTQSGWTTYEFAAPVRLAPGVAYAVFVQAEHTFETGGADCVPVARQPAGLSAATSRLGLMTTPADEGRFSFVSAVDSTPFSTVNAWYWMDPQVEAAHVVGPRVIGGSTVSWDGSSPVTVPIPPLTQASDTVVLFAKVQGTPVDPPGWTLAGRSTDSDSTVSVYTRTGLAAGADIQLDPGSIGAGGVSVLTVRDALNVAFSESVASTNQVGDDVDWPGTTIAADDTLLVVAPWATFRTVAAAGSLLPGVFSTPGISLFHDHYDTGATGPITMTVATGGAIPLKVAALQITG